VRCVMLVQQRLRVQNPLAARRIGVVMKQGHAELLAEIANDNTGASTPTSLRRRYWSLCAEPTQATPPRATLVQV